MPCAPERWRWPCHRRGSHRRGSHPGWRGHPGGGRRGHSGVRRGTEAAGAIPRGAVKDSLPAPRHPRGDKCPPRTRPDAAESTALEPRPGVNTKNPMGRDIPEMVGDEHGPAIDDDGPVEIVENIKSREPEARPPEGRGYPAVQIIKIGRRRVICHDRRTFVVIIIVHYLGVRVIFRTRWRGFGAPRRRVGRYRQVGTVQGIAEPS